MTPDTVRLRELTILGCHKGWGYGGNTDLCGLFFMYAEYSRDQVETHFLELEWVLDRVEQSTTHYQVLGLERSATIDQIKLEYEQTITLLNPFDYRHRTLPDNMRTRIRQAFNKVSKSYSVLNFANRVD